MVNAVISTPVFAAEARPSVAPAAGTVPPTQEPGPGNSLERTARGASSQRTEEADKRQAEESPERTLDRIAQRLVKLDARLLIDADEATSNFIYKLIERGSGEIVRQYPSEKILEMLRALKELDARFVDERA